MATLLVFSGTPCYLVVSDVQQVNSVYTLTTTSATFSTYNKQPTLFRPRIHGVRSLMSYSSSLVPRLLFTCVIVCSTPKYMCSLMKCCYQSVCSCSHSYITTCQTYLKQLQVGSIVPAHVGNIPAHFIFFQHM